MKPTQKTSVGHHKKNRSPLGGEDYTAAELQRLANGLARLRRHRTADGREVIRDITKKPPKETEVSNVLEIPAGLEAAKKVARFPWNPENEEVPIKFEIPAINEDELLAEAQAIVGITEAERASPAFKVARSLAEHSRSREPRFDTLAEVVIESAKNPAKHVFGFNHKSGRSIRKFRQFAEWIKGARRFTLETDFVTRAYELSLQPPTKLLDLALIARSPGEKVWIEWDEQVRLRIRKLDRGSMPAGAKLEQFDACGFAITLLEDGTHIVEVVGLLPEGVAMEVLAFAVEPSGTKRPVAFRDADLKLHDLVTNHLGSQGGAHGLALDYVNFWLKESPTIQNDAIVELLQRMRYCFSRAIQWFIADEQHILSSMRNESNLNKLLAATEGDYRFLLGVLALMSSTYTQMDRIEQRDVNVGQLPHRHRKDFLSYSKVLLRLPKEQPLKVVLRDLGKGVIAHKRRHTVLPHWAERRKTKFNGCNHQMQALDPRRLKCVMCGHLKWHVRNHERGDASLGYIHKDYVVTASKLKI